MFLLEIISWREHDDDGNDNDYNKNNNFSITTRISVFPLRKLFKSITCSLAMCFLTFNVTPSGAIA